jgi:hypothetical protein
VAKHDCGSCRFFDEASDGKRGWCTHPERRESNSVRILVRAGELRCRNDWGQDQWQARVVSDQVLDVVMTDRTSPGMAARARVAIPALDREDSATVVARPVIAAPLVSMPSDSDQVETPRTVSDELNKELLRGAQARYRERQKNKGFAIASERKPESEPLIISNKYIPPSRDVSSPVNKGVTNSVYEFSTAPSESGFDDVPIVSSAEEPSGTVEPVRGAPSMVERAVRQAGRTKADWTELTEVAELVGPSESQSTVVNVAHRPTRNNRIQQQHRDTAEHLPLRESDIEVWAPASEEMSLDVRGPWASIPQCCQTCRDFRPAGNGQRGWCNNQWAFRHRRMVDADDIPCETSVGNWWIPGDEAWQGDFDISALGQPTPLMDRWFGRRTGHEEADDRQGERRRRSSGSW